MTTTFTIIETTRNNEPLTVVIIKPRLSDGEYLIAASVASDKRLSLDDCVNISVDAFCDNKHAYYNSVEMETSSLSEAIEIANTFIA